MKKTLLLSVVASTLIMAGGDIEPVAVPVVEEVVSGWDFSGQAVAYYQTRDAGAANDLFDQAHSNANVGLQLRAVNKDIFWGIGAGAEVSGLGTFDLEKDVVSGPMQKPNGNTLKGGWISQAYLTYGFGNTSFKVGRQELPKSLSPFAFSEAWNVFKNTFDSLLVVNTDIADTTLVGAYVYGANSHGNMSQFNDINPDGVYMLTVQNKSVENLTLTGTWYYAPDMLVTEDVNILWGDAKYSMNDFYGAVQGGTVMGPDDIGAKDTTAFGVKAGGNFGMFDGSIAYSSVDDGTVNIANLGTGVKTPLYTQMILNQNSIKRDSDTIVVRAGLKALGGKFGIAYGYSDMGATALSPVFSKTNGQSAEYSELDLTYKTKVFNDSTTLFAGYVYQDVAYDATDDYSQNMLRFWGRYNF